MALPQTLRRCKAGGMRASRPTFARRAALAPFSRAFAMACRGGPWPSRKPCPAVRPPGRCKHRPLQRLRYRRGCGFPFGRRPLPPSVGADSISARGTPRCRKPGRYGIGPYRGCANAEVAAYGVASGLVIGRRGGIYPTRGTLRQRGFAVGCGVCPAP